MSSTETVDKLSEQEEYKKEPDVWQKRRSALETVIGNYENALPQEANQGSAIAPQAKPLTTEKSLPENGSSEEKPEAKPTPPTKGNRSLPENGSSEEKENFETLIQCLKKFGQDQFDFFYKGFDDTAPDEQYKLNPSREFTKEYVLAVTLSQIGEDLEFIRRIADQRLSEEIRKTLQEADKLAWSALSPMIKARILPHHNDNGLQTTVMTYFQKSAAVRIIPYAPIALIAIPFTASLVKQDYLAIPHEVGHYVYRHVKGFVNRGKITYQRNKELKSIPQILGQKLMDITPSIPPYVRRWKEEIFADVYGCLVGGPVVALSFRDLAYQNSRAPIFQTPGEYFYGQFTEDDGVHPVPVLRPYLYVKVLEKMGLKALARALEEDWNTKVNGLTTFRSRYAGTSPENINIEEARAKVNEVVEKILELLPGPELDVWPRWSDNRVEPEGLEDLYRDFENTGIRKVVDEIKKLPRLSESGVSVEDLNKLWKEWVKRENFFPGINDPRTLRSIDPGKAQRLEELEQEPRYTWNHVFLGGGWATKGPGTQGSGYIAGPKN